MRKRVAHHYWKKLGSVSLWSLTALFVVFSLIAAFSLRQNNLTMIELRDALYVADEQGGDVETALRELREYVYSHMNTNLRSGTTSSEAPIQLTNSYYRFVAAEQARVGALGSNNQVYAAAQARCADIAELSERVQCVQQYITDNGGNKFQLNLPPKEFYTYDFVSPRWTPDIAGLALIAAFVSGALLAARLVFGLWARNNI